MRIGIDLGGTKTEGVVLDSGDAEIVRRRYPTPIDGGYPAILDTMVSLVNELEEHAGAPCRVGIGTPGALSRKTGRIKNSNTTCLIDQPLQADLSALLKREIRMENDANCFALSEALDGAGQGQAIVFGMILGTGVGGGIVVNQQLLTGLQSITGEWGHNPLCPDGPRCYCGRRGCIETFLSGPALVADYARRGGEPTTTAQTIAALAEDNDPLAQSVLSVFFNYFGQALATIINILDPHVVVIGGGLSCIDALYSRGREAAAPYVFNDEFATPIVSNINGDSAGVRGAAQLWSA
ncbi:MAG TPA: ROK family protein [Gammaproteobacteria bacterium]|nr:ROK family protein [Gammaproteobacteria bacterium]